ncbi:MAG: hypothetical protein WCH30_05745 [Chlorobiaceae bacterium]
MKKNLIIGLLISFATTGVFGGLSLAADRPAGPKPSVEISAKAGFRAPGERSFRKRGLRKKVSRRGFSKRAERHHKRHYRNAR